MKHLLAVIAAILVVGTATMVRAHEGHEHKIMGTVTMVHENHLELKSTEGKSVAVTVTDKTKILRGTEAAALGSLTVGERVVVTAVETKSKDAKPLMVATMVQVSATKTPPKK